MMQTCSALREHAAANRVGFSINYEAHDSSYGRKKTLDFALCIPTKTKQAKPQKSFASLTEQYAIVLSDRERELLSLLPPLFETPAERVTLALKVKACMTGHAGAVRRLYDELDSWQMSMAEMEPEALRAGIVIVNCAEEFRSPIGRGIAKHSQPKAARQVVDAVARIPRASNKSSDGFDSLSVILVDCSNDGKSPVRCQDADSFHLTERDDYCRMIREISSQYGDSFADERGLS